MDWLDIAYRAATAQQYQSDHTLSWGTSRVVGVKYLKHVALPSSRASRVMLPWLQTQIRFLKADCCNWIHKHTVETKHVSSECDIRCWWKERGLKEWTSILWKICQFGIYSKVMLWDEVKCVFLSHFWQRFAVICDVQIWGDLAFQQHRKAIL